MLKDRISKAQKISYGDLLAMPTTFSDYAQSEMLNLYLNHSNEVGSELKRVDPAAYAGLDSTDCITYALNVISHAYEQVGLTQRASAVWTDGKDPNGKFKGTILAQKLVKYHNWVGIYINPDVVHPVDADKEHNFTNHIVNKTCAYHRIPVKYKAVNYNTTPKTHSAYQQLIPYKGETTLDTTNMAIVKDIKFGFGLSRGGRPYLAIF